MRRLRIPEPLWRIAATIGMYLTYTAVKTGGFYIMRFSPFLRYTGGYWNVTLVCRVLLPLSLLAYFSIASVFVLHDVRYRARCAEASSQTAQPLPRRRRILRDAAFRWQAATVAASVVLAPSQTFFFEVREAFFPDAPLLTAHAVTVLLMVPLLMLLTFAAHLATRNWWRRRAARRETPVSRRAHVLAFVRQLLFTCVVYLFAALALSAIFPAIATVFTLISFHLPAFLILLALLLVGAVSYRHLRALYHRHRLWRRLRRICRASRYEIKHDHPPYAAILAPRAGASFHLFARGQVYACKLLCATRRRLPLFFDEQGRVSYTVSHDVLGFDLVHDTVSMAYAFEGRGKRLLLLDPPVDAAYITDGTAKRLLDTGDTFLGYTLYTADTFLRALERDSL